MTKRREKKREREEALKNSYSLKAMVKNMPPTPGFRRIPVVPLSVKFIIAGFIDEEA